MNSFFFWLTVAACFGAVLAQTVQLGAPEIVIVAILANVAFYGYRRIARTRPLPA